jgi:hypothetical protein
VAFGGGGDNRVSYQHPISMFRIWAASVKLAEPLNARSPSETTHLACKPARRLVRSRGGRRLMSSSIYPAGSGTPLSNPDQPYRTVAGRGHALAARRPQTGLSRRHHLARARLAWGIELKRRGGELSKSRWERNKRGRLRFKVGQAEMFPRVLRTGAFAEIETAYSVDAMLDHIEAWRIPMRGRIMA